MKESRSAMMILSIVLISVGGLLIGYFVTSSINFQSSNSSVNSLFLAPQASVATSLLPPHPPPSLKSGCYTLALNSVQSTIPKFAGNPSTLVYGCGKKGVGSAFTTVPSPRDRTSTVFATFMIPSGWSLEVGIAKASGDCSSTDNVVTLVSGNPLTLSSGTGYIYCLTTEGASSFRSFAITWS